MNKRAKKTFDKAINFYEKGKIDRALELCEEVLSEGLDNPIVLNFKGLLLYQKGNLNEAVTVWRINKELNNNYTAKNYIKDVIADEKRLELYKQGEQALKQLKIDKALELFNMCAESDFNSIKVNTGIAMCYQKKGQFYMAMEYVDKALNIDQSAVAARAVEKELKKDGIYSKVKNSSRSFLIGITTLFLIFSVAAGGYLVKLKFNNKNLSNSIENKNNKELEENSINQENKRNEVEENIEINSGDTTNEILKEKSQNMSFDKEKLKTLIANNDLEGIYQQLKNVKEESISDEDSAVYKNAIDVMKDQGASKFYEDGLSSFKQQNYSDAKVSFDKAYTYCEGSSLKEHILFYRASNSYKGSDNNALEQYEEYYNEYPNGVYVQEALYELALLSNSIDKEKSKDYANTLINNFPDSIYINDNIVSISRS
jgi:tetratricopeptide (TPR) repeat protein